MFDAQQISDYYDQTEVHYRYFWDLDESHALHYGIWNKGTRSFKESLLNTNKELARIAGIHQQDKVLDAGCGVGGSALFLADTIGCEVTGISLSAKQIAKANLRAEKKALEHLLSFEAKNYCDTGYPDDHFDVIWALESVGSATNKKDFVREAFRILKPGGRLVVADYFKTSDYPIESQKVMQTWLNGWAISDLETVENFKGHLENYHFKEIRYTDQTKEITKSARRMYYASFLGFIGTKLYNFFKNASPFSKIHYKSGIAQYQALKRSLWQYGIFLAKK